MDHTGAYKFRDRKKVQFSRQKIDNNNDDDNNDENILK